MFVDTNIFLRHLLNDHPDQSVASREFLRRIALNEIRAWTSDLVVAEIIYVLTGPYTPRLTRTEMRDLVLPLIQLDGLQTPSKQLWPRVFDLFTSTNVDFIDAYNAALAEQRGEIEVMSYDHDFDELAGLDRREPPPVPAGDPGQP